MADSPEHTPYSWSCSHARPVAEPPLFQVDDRSMKSANPAVEEQSSVSISLERLVQQITRYETSVENDTTIREGIDGLLAIEMKNICERPKSFGRFPYRFQQGRILDAQPLPEGPDGDSDEYLEFLLKQSEAMKDEKDVPTQDHQVLAFHLRTLPLRNEDKLDLSRRIAFALARGYRFHGPNTLSRNRNYGLVSFGQEDMKLCKVFDPKEEDDPEFSPGMMKEEFEIISWRFLISIVRSFFAGSKFESIYDEVQQRRKAFDDLVDSLLNGIQRTGLEYQEGLVPRSVLPKVSHKTQYLRAGLPLGLYQRYQALHDTSTSSTR